MGRKYQKRAGPVWDEEALRFQKLYGLEGFAFGNCRPKFGVDVRLPLIIGGLHQQTTEITAKGEIRVTQEPDIGNQAPTLEALAYHFGDMKWAVDFVIRAVRSRELIPEDFWEAVHRLGKERLTLRVVNPHRKALLTCPFPLYLYCVDEEVYTVDDETGRLILTRRGEGQVLCLLPKSPEVGRHYQLADEELRLLAPQVGYVIRTRCSHGSIDSPERLLQELSGWVDLTPRRVLEDLADYLETKKPRLLKAESIRALLPG